jgi:predicted transcriptional regulator
MINGLLNIDNNKERISSNQYNKEIDEAVSRIENGNFVSHKDALKEISKW